MTTDVVSMSLSAIKAELAQKKVDISRLIERQELVDALVQQGEHGVCEQFRV